MKRAALLFLAACAPQASQDERYAAFALLVDRGRYSKAEEGFRELLGEGYPAEVGLGIALLEQGALEEAVQCLEGTHAHAYLADAYVSLGRSQEAVDESWLALDGDPSSLHNLADAYAHAGDKSRAESLYRDALFLTPPWHENYPITLRDLGELLRGRCSYGSAEALWAEADYLEAFAHADTNPPQGSE